MRINNFHFRLKPGRRKRARLFLLFLTAALAGCQGLPTAAPQAPPTRPPEAAAPTSTPMPTAALTLEPPTPTPAAPAPTSTPNPRPTGTQPAAPAAFPDPQAYEWRAVAGGFDRPIGIVSAGGGSGRLFILEQPGLIQVVENDRRLEQPFLDIRGLVGSSGNEQGLLGLAFHPKYLENGYFYINYTDKNGGTVIARFTGKQTADASTQKILLRVKQPYPNHNGGGMQFGPDGYLYLGLGDGGSAGDPQGNGQSLQTYLGKLLRIDVDHGDPYAIPADNPLAGGGGKAEIFAYGLRNPWRFSFDALTGDLYIGDVGQDRYEEIDWLPAGTTGLTNFGWNNREGLHAYRGGAGKTAFTDPVFEYSHGPGCSVTGGAVYRGKQLPEWFGVYLYGDYCSGKIWGLIHSPDGSWQNRLLFSSGEQISTFGVDDSGEIYFAGMQQGGIMRLSRR
jgi:glucose/arabinose dehydrogenase